MLVFIEAAFIQSDDVNAADGWRDISTDDYFEFVSNFGVLRLRRRSAWPQTFAYVKDSVLYFGYGDRSTGQRILQQPLHEADEELFYGDEFLVATADCQKQICTIQRDGKSTLPLFLSVQTAPHRRFSFSNKYERVYQIIREYKKHINDYPLAMLLVGEDVTGKTLLREIDTLYDRARVKWSASGYEKEQAPHGKILEVARSREGDPREFRKRIEETLDKYWHKYAAEEYTVGTEFSCGLDTSAINGYLSLTGRKFYPATLAYHDTYRESIQKRLAIFSEKFSLYSHQIEMNPESDYPLSKMVEAAQCHPFYHAAELYEPSLDKIARYLEEKGATAIFRGVGGDELFENIPKLEHDIDDPYFPEKLTLPSYMTKDFKEYFIAAKSRHPHTASIPLLSNSVTAASLSGNNVYIDHGIWPVYPLADAKLYLYCQSLPIQYRYERAIMRAYLHARGFPEEIYQPKINENFGQFFKGSVPEGLENVFNVYMDNSVLAKKGLIDATRAQQSWQDIISRSLPRRRDTELFQLYCLLVAEINLQFENTDNYSDLSPLLSFK